MFVFFQELTSKDLAQIEDAISVLTVNGKKKLLVEKDELEQLKEELADYQAVSSIFLVVKFSKVIHGINKLIIIPDNSFKVGAKEGNNFQCSLPKFNS